MLFFQEYRCRKLSKTKNNRTSPVRNSFYCMRIMHVFREKRALSPASRPLSNSADGSLALEAALALTLFLFACVCLAAPIKLFDQQRKIQGALEQAGEDLSRYAYVKYCLDEGDGEVECGDDIASILTIGYVRRKVMSVVDQRMIRQVSLVESRILEDDMICLRVSYRFYLPVAFPGISSIPMEAVCVRRAWTGAEGGRHSASGASGEVEDPIVYVGKGSTRYHLSARCHYLHNNLQAVGSGEVSGLRNAEGGRYSPCKRCVSGTPGGTVYVMPSGSSYHTSPDCTAIVAYVRAVRKSTVAYLGACSYCGRE